jgi:hypothetical protein
MSEPRHTPGPWEVTGKSGDDVIIETQAEMPDPDHVYGRNTVVGSSEWTFCRAEDARLIAAAPDLLAACRAALSQIEGMRDLWTLAGEDGNGPRLVAQLRAAIARATEEDPSQ